MSAWAFVNPTPTCIHLSRLNPASASASYLTRSSFITHFSISTQNSSQTRHDCFHKRPTNTTVRKSRPNRTDINMDSFPEFPAIRFQATNWFNKKPSKPTFVKVKNKDPSLLRFPLTVSSVTPISVDSSILQVIFKVDPSLVKHPIFPYTAPGQFIMLAKSRDANTDAVLMTMASPPPSAHSHGDNPGLLTFLVDAKDDVLSILDPRNLNVEIDAIPNENQKNYQRGVFWASPVMGQGLDLESLLPPPEGFENEYGQDVQQTWPTSKLCLFVDSIHGLAMTHALLEWDHFRVSTGSGAWRNTEVTVMYHTKSPSALGYTQKFTHWLNYGVTVRPFVGDATLDAFLRSEDSHLFVSRALGQVPPPNTHREYSLDSMYADFDYGFRYCGIVNAVHSDVLAQFISNRFYPDGKGIVDENQLQNFTLTTFQKQFYSFLDDFKTRQSSDNDVLGQTHVKTAVQLPNDVNGNEDSDETEDDRLLHELENQVWSDWCTFRQQQQSSIHESFKREQVVEEVQRLERDRNNQAWQSWFQENDDAWNMKNDDETWKTYWEYWEKEIAKWGKGFEQHWNNTYYDDWVPDQEFKEWNRTRNWNWEYREQQYRQNQQYNQQQQSQKYVPHVEGPSVNFYEVLGIARGASFADIKNAYRQQALKYHPDIYDGDKKFASIRIKQIILAYTVLKDESSRRTYDFSGTF